MFVFKKKLHKYFLKIADDLSEVSHKEDSIIEKSFLIESSIPSHFITTRSIKIDSNFFYSKEHMDLFVFPYVKSYALSHDNLTPQWMFVYDTPESAIQDGTRRFPNSHISLLLQA